MTFKSGMKSCITTLKNKDMKKMKFLIFLILIIGFSCNSPEDDSIPVEEIEVLEFGTIEGLVRLQNEYGIHPYGEEESVTISLTNKKTGQSTVLQTGLDHRRFEFDSLEYGTYILHAESPTYKTCELFEFELSKDELFHRKEIELKSVDFTATLNSVQFDSLVGDSFYHSFDIEKVNDNTLEVRFYFSDEPNVSNQNYIETAFNLAAWASPETSGQYRLFLKITPELYERDSIYTCVYLVNRNADECIGDNGLIYHYPFSQDHISFGFKK